MISLTKAPCNLVLEIKSFADSFGWARRLESMGIRKGQRVRKIACQPFGGPVVIEVGGCCVSMGRGIASKIDVEVVSESVSQKEATSEPMR
ncbi:FeoA family protein [Methanocrinis sp.]|uniref:FeoA family protein n=1 Tax=Methanocrinis sp. TaxID=3101522 RepID=UPI003D0E83E8